MSSTVPSKKAETVRVWIVEDNRHYRRSLQGLCNAEPGCSCDKVFSNAEEVLAALTTVSARERPDVMLLDVRLPGRSGLDIIEEVNAAAPRCQILIITVFEDEEKIAQAISRGACGYLLKSAHPREVVEAVFEASQGGSPMSPAVARKVVTALARLTKPAATVPLAPREREILALLVEGLTAKEITDRLGISIHTIDGYTRKLFSKLGVHNRASAVARAMRDRLV